MGADFSYAADRRERETRGSQRPAAVGRGREDELVARTVHSASAVLPPSALLSIQRSAGNRAAALYVQRCGSTPPEECPCHADEASSSTEVSTERPGLGDQRHEFYEAHRGDTVQRWALGGAPAPSGWQVVADPAQVAKVGQAEATIRGVLASRNCQNYFGGNCSDGSGAAALQQAFDNALIYHRPVDDNAFGASINGTPNISYNRRSLRIGAPMMASTLLHEMFHTCDPVLDANDELDAENAVEACRLHTPWIDSVSPRSGGAGSRITILGWGFGPRRQSVDAVRVGGMNAAIVSWVFLTDNSSRVRIVAEVPAGPGTGAGAGAGQDIVVVNNGVESNRVSFTLT